MMDRWMDLVDLLIVMACEPKTSIEREYLNQLDNQRRYDHV